MATEVIKVVDPDNGPGTDYTSLSAWEAGEQQDLVTNDRIAIAKCRCTSGSADTTAVTIDGWTTDSTHYIKIWTDPSEGYRHNGKWDETKYRLVGANATRILVREENIRIDGLQISVTGTNEPAQDAIFFYNIDGTANAQVSNSIMKGVSSSDTFHAGILTYYMGVSSTFKFWNNIFYGFSGASHTNAGIYFASTYYNYTVYLYNNTAYGCTSGFYRYSGSYIIAKNNISYNNTDNYYGTFDSSSTNNLSGPTQTDAPGSNPRNGVTVTFVDEANKDFHLASTDTGARNYGADLSSDPYLAFSDDIDGQTRPGETAWDIGADEYVQSVTLIQSAYRFFNDDGDESSSTPAASENTGITYPRGSNLRIRIQVDASGDPPSQQYQLEYAIQGGDWEKITS